MRQRESLKLARTELQQQFERTEHPARKTQIAQAVAEIETAPHGAGREEKPDAQLVGKRAPPRRPIVTVERQRLRAAVSPARRHAAQVDARGRGRPA